MSQRFYGQFSPQVDEVAWGYFPQGFKGHAIEVGACDGIFYSNTYAFEQCGWVCLAIEPNPEWMPALSQNRKHVCTDAMAGSNGFAMLTIYDIGQADHSGVTGIDTDQRLVAGYSAKILRQIEVRKRTLDEVLREAGPLFPKLDYLSIDTEGSELDVLKGFDIQRWKPKLIIVENNFDDIEIPSYMDLQKYKRVRRVGVNDFFTHE